MAASYKGPAPIELGDGSWECGLGRKCHLGADGGPAIYPTQFGAKAHWTHKHNGGAKHGRPSKAETNGHVEAMFDSLAAVTKALVADAPDEIYTRMEEIVEVRKHLARYLAKRVQ